MQEFFAMGGYAAFIWPAYGAAAVILIGLLVASVTGLNRRRAELTRLEAVRSEDRKE